MNIQKDIDKIRQAMKLLWEVANDCKANVSCTAIVSPVGDEKELGCRPFITTDVEDYKFEFDEDTGFTCDYRPVGENGKLDFDARQYDLDQRQITSFKIPPEKSPAADQSKQGMSVDEIAQHHLSISEGVGQE